MPIARIQMPDGRVARLEVPEGTTPDQAMQFLQSMPKEESNGFDFQGALNTFARGASFGFADELAGAVSAMTGGDYASARDAWNQRQEQFTKDNPVTAAGVELVGGLASGIPGAAGLARGFAAAPKLAALSRLPTTAKLAGAGAASGGLYGAGTADSGERLGGAASSAAVGAATGAILPPALRMAGRGARAVGRAGANVAKQLTESGSDDIQRATKKVAQALARDDTTPQKVAAEMRKLGPKAVLADAGGENLKGLAEAATSIPGRAKNIGRKVLDDRAKGAQRRLVSVISKSLGADDLDFDSAVIGLHDNMRQIAAKEGYDDILNAGIVRMDDQLKKMAEGSTMKRALGQAYSILDDDIALGRADAKLRDFFTFTNPRTGQTMEVPALVAQFSDDTLKPAGARFDPANYAKTSEPTLRVWDYVKRGLDSVISEGTDPVTGKLTSQAERAAAFKRSLVSKLDDAAPDYARIRGMYADEKAAESAMRLGRAFMREDAEVTARRLVEMSESEKQFFRLGAARALHDKVMNSIDTGTSWRSIVKNPLIRSKVEKLFPDRNARAEFMRAMEREMRFAGTRATASPAGKSPTGRILAQQSDLDNAPELIEAGVNVARGGFGQAVTQAVRALKNRNASGMPENVRNALADVLFSDDPQVTNKLINALQRSPQFKPKALPISPRQGLYAGQAGAMALER